MPPNLGRGPAAWGTVPAVQLAYSTATRASTDLRSTNLKSKDYVLLDGYDRWTWTGCFISLHRSVSAITCSWSRAHTARSKIRAGAKGCGPWLQMIRLSGDSATTDQSGRNLKSKLGFPRSISASSLLRRRAIERKSVSRALHMRLLRSIEASLLDVSGDHFNLSCRIKVMVKARVVEVVLPHQIRGCTKWI